MFNLVSIDTMPTDQLVSLGIKKTPMLVLRNQQNHTIGVHEGQPAFEWLNNLIQFRRQNMTNMIEQNRNKLIQSNMAQQLNKDNVSGKSDELTGVSDNFAYINIATNITAITNTKLLTCTNKNDIWEQADGKPFTKVTGGPTISNTQRKFTTSSALYFAGTTNTYLLKDLGETIGTRDFTVEAWVYPTSTGAQHVFQISNQTAGHQAITSQNTQIGIGLNNGKWRYGTTGGNAGYQHTTADVVTNTWHHVAYVRTGGYSKLYLNGTEIHSNADTANYSARYLAYGVGHQSNNMWSGYTQDLRISLDYARYTSNFTPPDSTFEG